jgi:hypothetical protein
MNDITNNDKQFVSEIAEIIRADKNVAYRTVNFTMTETYWQIGKRIVEQEQHGNKRADYGEQLLSLLSK